MDVIANRVALSSGLKKEKSRKNKTKTKKLSKPTESVKSPPRITKKKNLQVKGDKLKSKKGVLKETLKNVESGDSSKLYKKVAEPLVKVDKSKKTREIPQVVKKEKRGDNKEITEKIKKHKNTDNEVPQKVKKQKRKETEPIPQKAKKQKVKEITKKIKKEKNTDNEEVPQKVKKQKSKETESIPQKAKKQKVKETKVITQKVKKEKEVEDSKKEIVIGKESTKSAPKAQLSLIHVKKSVAAVLKLAKDETNPSSADKVLLNEGDDRIFLQVVCVKIPKTPFRQLRILLPHTLVTPNDDVALIVKDLKRGRRRDHEPTVDHFQELLKKHKCTQIKTVIPMNQIKNEYTQFELKRNLVNSYDHFLVDGRISGHVARLLGKLFTKKRKLPTSIRMGSKDLNHEIDYALSKTIMRLSATGDSHTMQIGTTSMKKSEIVENIETACDGLAKSFPGGWANIRSVLIKTPTSLAIPIYVTMKSKNKVNVPVVEPKRPKAYRTYEGELTTLTREGTVSVNPDGTVTVNTEFDSETEDEEEEVKDEIKNKDKSEDEDEDEN